MKRFHLDKLLKLSVINQLWSYHFSVSWDISMKLEMRWKLAQCFNYWFAWSFNMWIFTKDSQGIGSTLTKFPSQEYSLFLSFRLQRLKSMYFFILLFLHTTSVLKSLVILVIWKALIGTISSQMAPFLVLSCIFFPVKREAKFTKKQPIDCLKKPITLQENEKQLLQLPTN